MVVSCDFVNNVLCITGGLHSKVPLYQYCPYNRYCPRLVCPLILLAVISKVGLCSSATSVYGFFTLFRILKTVELSKSKIKY